ncbi:Curli production assembly/transport component CsgG [Bizionia sp. KMM 8389]
MKVFNMSKRSLVFGKSISGFLFICVLFFNTKINAQTTSSDSALYVMPKVDFYDYRGTNALSAGIGATLFDADIENVDLGLYFSTGYKRTIIPYLHINLTLNTFDLVYQGRKHGFFSADLSAEVLILPHSRFSPYVYAGGGTNSDKHFNDLQVKGLAGIGVDYVIYEGLSFRFFFDYNKVFNKDETALVTGINDVYWRLACGLSFYFGGEKKKVKLLESVPTIFKTNPIPANK